MKRVVSKTVMVLLAAMAMLGLCRCKEKKAAESIPGIDQIGKNTVTISWSTREKSEGTIVYRRADKTTGRPTNGKDTRESVHHTVQITDLNPGTLYSYWIKEAKTRYTFRTEPEKDRQFSFLVCGGGSPEEELELVKSEGCSFMLVTGKINKGDYREAEAFVPVRSFAGKDSSSGKAINRTFDFGNLRLLLLNEADPVNPLKDLTADQPSGIVVSAGVLPASPQELQKSGLHKAIAAYNRVNPEKPVLFAGIAGEPGMAAAGKEGTPKTFVIDKVNYFVIPAGENGKAGSVVLTVEGLASNIYYPADESASELTVPPVHSSKSCVEGQRLARQGKYPESIEACRAFIRKYEKEYKTDQAYYLVARTYDENLCDFKEAVKWYKNLVDSFAVSDYRDPSAERMHYLATYSDCDFIPLQEFEKIRSAYPESAENAQRQQRQRKPLTSEQKELITGAEKLGEKYSGCQAHPLILSWIADHYKQNKPATALKYYKQVLEKYPEFSLDHEILYKVAETYLAGGQTGKAKETFLLVKKVLPQLSEKVDSQLTRLQTKSRRASLRDIAWALCLILLIAALLIKPFSIRMPRMKLLLFTLLGFVYSFIMFFIAVREEIAEDFNSSYKEIILFFLSFSVITMLAMITGRTFSMKLWKENPLKARLAGSFLSMIFFVSSFYLVVYHIYEQYLSFINL